MVPVIPPNRATITVATVCPIRENASDEAPLFATPQVGQAEVVTTGQPVYP
jgi:hypothetical protein